MHSHGWVLKLLYAEDNMIYYKFNNFKFQLMIISSSLHVYTCICRAEYADTSNELTFFSTVVINEIKIYQKFCLNLYIATNPIQLQISGKWSYRGQFNYKTLKLLSQRYCWKQSFILGDMIKKYSACNHSRNLRQNTHVESLYCQLL